MFYFSPGLNLFISHFNPFGVLSVQQTTATPNNKDNFPRTRLVRQKKFLSVSQLFCPQKQHFLFFFVFAPSATAAPQNKSPALSTGASDRSYNGNP
jgi:hypothetical protein